MRTSVKAHDFKRRSLIIHAASGSCELPCCALEYSSRSMQTKKKLATRAIGDASHYSKRSCRSDHVTPLLLFMLYFRDAIGRQTGPDQTRRRWSSREGLAPLPAVSTSALCRANLICSVWYAFAWPSPLCVARAPCCLRGCGSQRKFRRRRCSRRRRRMDGRRWPARPGATRS